MIIALTDMGFNPRICKRCDFGSATKQGDLPVSIHASVKDATQPYVFEIHKTCFNPRICKRCDSPVLKYQYLPKAVSIHASVKDATYLP